MSVLDQLFIQWLQVQMGVCVFFNASYVAEEFPLLVHCTWQGNSNTSQVWASCGATRQSLNVHVIHQMAGVCCVNSAEAAASSSMCLAAGNEACCVTFSTMAGRVHNTTAWKGSDHVSTISVVHCTSTQGLLVYNCWYRYLVLCVANFVLHAHCTLLCTVFV